MSVRNPPKVGQTKVKKFPSRTTASKYNSHSPNGGTRWGRGLWWWAISHIDLSRAFWAFYFNPRKGCRKYNQNGGCASGRPRGWRVAASARIGSLLVQAVQACKQSMVILFSTFLVNVSLPHQWQRTLSTHPMPANTSQDPSLNIDDLLSSLKPA